MGTRTRLGRVRILAAALMLLPVFSNGALAVSPMKPNGAYGSASGYVTDSPTGRAG